MRGISNPTRLLHVIVGFIAVGKIQFAQTVFKMRGVPTHFDSAANFHAGFEIIGNTSQWSNARPGLLIDVFMDMGLKTPVIV